jgi:spermidine/putrescine transport system substrate-binding protein
VIPAGRLSRRRFLRGLGGGGLALGAGLLAACGGPDLTPVPVSTRTPDKSRTEHVVNFANWLDYVDSEGSGKRRRHPTLAEFTRRSGIRVNYTEPITDNLQIVGEIGVPLAMGRFTGYDLLVVTDWIVAELARIGWVQRLSAAAVPNAGRLVPEFRNHPLPDVARYSLPWQAGFTGIAWNQDLTHRPVRSMTDLLTARDLHGKVGLVPEMRDVMGLLLLDMGVDPASFTDADFSAALKVLDRAVVSGQIRSVTSNYVPQLRTGNLAACVAWPSDIIFAQPQYPQLQTALPAAGGMLWTDNMVIPAFARHKLNAERLMNFYYEPPVAAQLSAYELYICPVQGTQAVMRGLDPALAGQQYIFPSHRLLAQGHYFRLLPAAVSAEYSNAYASAVGL